MDVKNEYFYWLCKQIETDEYPPEEYYFLLKALLRKEFHWLVANDDNREAEGKRLRTRFCDLYELDLEELEELEGPCSVLEMLIALSYRVDAIMVDSKYDFGSPVWFWMFLENLDLVKYVNDTYLEGENNLVVNDILDTFIDRKYRRNGKGGIFPLENAKKDQRKVELWYQMHTFLLEKYHDNFID